MDTTTIAEPERARKVGAMTRAELAEAIHEDEQQLGRPHSPGEREAFTRGFLGLGRDDGS